MSLPPIPKRRGMIAHSAQWDAEEGRWRNVLYRPARQAKLEAASAQPEGSGDKRGMVGREQGDLFND